LTIREAILKSLNDLKKAVNYIEVYNHIKTNNYYPFSKGKTPKATISALLGDFIRAGDNRVKRIKLNNSGYLYYLTKFEKELNFEIEIPKDVINKKSHAKPKSIKERDLHILLSTYLKNQEIYSKTIFHEKSNQKSQHQKWIHPDIVGVHFLNLQTKVSQTFLKVINKADTFKISSYEIKNEIMNDYDLKKCFFQAVSNSSWANFGYLVAFEMNESLLDEMERLNQSFGIGIIKLNSNPFESKIIFPAKYKEIDIKTIDKLCKINNDFKLFIEQVEKYVNASEKYLASSQLELENFCDTYFKNDSEIEKYCKSVGIEFSDKIS